MDVCLEVVSPDKKYIIENMFKYYVYDMSEFTKWGPNACGEFGFPPHVLEPYWNEADHIPYFITVDGDIAGFLLLRKYPSNPNLWDIGQFFILRKYKGRGVGKLALKTVVSMHLGDWQVRVLQENSGALCFWRSAIRSLVGEDFTYGLEQDVDLEMHFLRFKVT